MRLIQFRRNKYAKPRFENRKLELFIRRGETVIQIHWRQRPGHFQLHERQVLHLQALERLCPRKGLWYPLLAAARRRRCRLTVQRCDLQRRSRATRLLILAPARNLRKQFAISTFFWQLKPPSDQIDSANAWITLPSRYAVPAVFRQFETEQTGQPN